MTENAALTTPTPAFDTAGPTTLFVILRRFNSFDADSRCVSVEEFLSEEGWFLDAASAQARCDELSAPERSYYEETMAGRQRLRDRQIKQAEQANRQAAASRAAGLKKDDVAVPEPFEPMGMEKFYSLNGGRRTHEAVAIRRADRDGLSHAGRAATA